MEFAQFKDFNFKLAVIQILMYQSQKLRPRFNVCDLPGFDVEEDGYEIVPQARQFFADLPIPLRYLDEIETIVQNGGHAIYLQIFPFWDGEDDTFNIRATDDAALLANLREITLFYDPNPAILASFAARGIEAQWT